MKFWQSTAFNDPLELPEIARGAEAAGFEGILVSDHLFVPAQYEPAYLYSDSGRPDFDTTTPFPRPLGHDRNHGSLHREAPLLHADLHLAPLSPAGGGQIRWHAFSLLWRPNPARRRSGLDEGRI